MLYDPTTAHQLKPWLVRTLEPICDAEPGALADYILALLKHNAPENEMRKELTSQLEEFLEKECSNFIDMLFTVLRTKSYMPYSAGADSPPLQVTPLDGGSGEGGIPIPLDGLLASTSSSRPPRSRKRSNSAQDDDGRPHKGPRLGHGQSSDGEFAGYAAQQMVTGGQWPMGMGMGMNPYGMPMGGMGMHNGHGRRNQGYQPPDQRRGICRDYHHKGFCARGEMCKFSHGDDAVVPEEIFQGGPMPFMPMFPGAVPQFMQSAVPNGGAYDPHDSLRGNRQHQRAPLLPRIQGQDGALVQPTGAGELPVIQDLTPGSSQPRQPLPNQQTQNLQPLPSTDIMMAGMTGYEPLMAMLAAAGGFAPMEGVNGEAPMGDGTGSHAAPSHSGRGGFRGRGRGGHGRGGPPSSNGSFPTGDASSFRPQKRQDKTLVVEKIPADKLTRDVVHEWFTKFGTVTEVAIDRRGGKALVSFEQHDDAHKAWRSEEAVFGNRFVKVFWHRPLEGHGTIGAKMLKDSESALKAKNDANNTPNATTNTSVAPSVGPPSTQPAPRKPSAAVTALAAKQQVLEHTIAEQKSLMAQLDKASGEEKKEIMAKLRKLGEEMKNLTAAPSKTETSASQKGKEKEKVAPEQVIETKDSVESSTSSSQTTEDLKAKLERLKAEAASLGLDSALGTSSAPPYRGSYRGRPPRGRGAYYRGGPPMMRGGPPRASMKLDNRPRKLLVKGVSEEHAQALRDWYETTGQIESLEPLSSTEPTTAYVVSFKSRSAAEQGLAKGSNIPIVGPVQMSWFTGKEGSTVVTGAGASTGSGSKKDEAESKPVDVDVNTTSPGRGHLPEEEEVASGWGGDGDDGDGMGML